MPSLSSYFSYTRNLPPHRKRVFSDLRHYFLVLKILVIFMNVNALTSKSNLCWTALKFNSLRTGKIKLTKSDFSRLSNVLKLKRGGGQKYGPTLIKNKILDGKKYTKIGKNEMGFMRHDAVNRWLKCSTAKKSRFNHLFLGANHYHNGPIKLSVTLMDQQY